MTFEELFAKYIFPFITSAAGLSGLVALVLQRMRDIDAKKKLEVEIQVAASNITKIYQDMAARSAEELIKRDAEVAKKNKEIETLQAEKDQRYSFLETKFDETVARLEARITLLDAERIQLSLCNEELTERVSILETLMVQNKIPIPPKSTRANPRGSNE